jgi:hypothetical protein
MPRPKCAAKRLHLAVRRQYCHSGGRQCTKGKYAITTASLIWCRAGELECGCVCQTISEDEWVTDKTH